MEYGSRILQQIGKLPGFKYHSRCKSMQLNHLCFADDMLLFCKGDMDSISMILGGLKLFSETTGLHISPEKSEIYCTGMSASDILKVQLISGFKVGSLPFKYLGVPMNSKKVNEADCQALVEKMCARIRIWSSRHLSYSGRLQLVNSVLMSICTYWSQIFIQPKLVIKKINVVCKHFLWHGTYDSTKLGYVNWDEVCKPKDGSGLGVMNLMLWN